MVGILANYTAFVVAVVLVLIVHLTHIYIHISSISVPTIITMTVISSIVTTTIVRLFLFADTFSESLVRGLVIRVWVI